MKAADLVVPILLVLAGVVGVLAPGLDSTPRVLVFCAASLGATSLGLLRRKPREFASSTQFEVSLRKLSFVHTERPREERPPASETVTQIYDKALAEFDSGNYATAASEYARAFVAGPDYWPARVNEGMSYQAMGRLAEALNRYEDVILRCPDAKFRRQALGNSGDILKELAASATKKEDADRWRASALEKFTAAYFTEKTFVSTHNLWDVSRALGLTEQTARLLAELKAYPEFKKFLTEFDH